jgi:uncharacterized protein (TIGR03437 family)
VTIGGLPATIVYAGPAPGQVAGMLQIDIIVPAAAAVSAFDLVELTVGNYSSPSGVTIAVQ